MSAEPLLSRSEATLFCTFKATDKFFGVPLLDIKEITKDTRCTPIPHAPAEVSGYVNIRGHIILALDLRRLMGWTGEVSFEPTCMVIFKSTVGPLFGLMVDDVGEIVSLLPSQLEPFQQTSNNGIDPHSRTELIHSIGKLNHELLVILSSRLFLPLVEKLTATSFLELQL